MSRWMQPALAFTLGALVSGGFLLAGYALAEEPEPEPEPAPEPVAAPVDSSLPQLRCTVFRHDMKHAIDVETADRTTEIGQWVGELEDEGWALYGVDFEVGQKHTGYPQGYTQVCMYPR